MNKIFSPEAWDDYVYWQNQDKKTLKKINALIKDIQHSGAECGIGKPEALKGELSGFWSRRIDEKIGWFIELQGRIWKLSHAKLTMATTSNILVVLFL